MAKDMALPVAQDRAVVNGAASVSAVPASVPSALRYATVADERHNLLRSVIAALGDEYERAQIVVQMPQREPVQPREVWIEDIAAWVRLDGTWCSFDLGRDAFRPTESQAMCIRLAAERWEAAQGTSGSAQDGNRLDPKGAGPVRDSECAQPSGPS